MRTLLGGAFVEKLVGINYAGSQLTFWGIAEGLAMSWTASSLAAIVVYSD